MHSEWTHKANNRIERKDKQASQSKPNGAEQEEKGTITQIPHKSVPYRKTGGG